MAALILLAAQYLHGAEQGIEARFHAPHRGAVGRRPHAPEPGVGLPQRERGEERRAAGDITQPAARGERRRRPRRRRQRQQRENERHRERRGKIARIGDQPERGDQHARDRAEGAREKHRPGARIARAAPAAREQERDQQRIHGGGRDERHE
ncbi:MAG: hypothetical protein HYV99_04460, partial [Betaproteobacteria bacterium]|nr:hypothetical protein [Betaproteobacteria bacterium]